MSALGRDSHGPAIPVFLIVERSPILDTREELLGEKIELFQECYSVERLGTSDHEALYGEDHARDDHRKEGHRYHELEDRESCFISATRSCDHRDER